MANSLIDGKMPFFEINEFQDGRAIAIGDEVVVSSDKEEFHLSGVVGLETGFDPNPVEKAVQNLNHEKISGGLAEWVGKNSNEKVAIKVYIERPSGFDTIFHRLEKEIARGNVLTFQDKDDAYDRALVAHQAIVKTQLLDLERTIKDIGGITLSKATNLFSLHALLSRSQILNLEKRQEITSLDLLDLKTNEGIVDGAEVIDGTQLFQYLDTSNYYNGDPFGIPLRFGIQEWKPIDDKHPAFLDWNSSSSSRIKKLWSCASGLCTAVSTFGTFPQNSHPTLVSGIALGDLMDGQDSSVTTYDARKARSGYARESDFYYYYGVNTGQFDTTIDRAISDNLALWSSSGGFGSTVNDINCKGETGGAKDLNSLYDSGTIPFFLAGNYGHLSATDCTLWHPASAIGAFVVGGHSQPNLATDEDDVRYGTSWTRGITGCFFPRICGSSRGGTSSQGKGRKIVDISGPACRTLWPKKYGTYGGNACGTSIATPTVAGASAGYLEYYKETISNAIDDPGLLSANLLLFGDRAGGSFSNLYGAGRLKMRYPVSSGLDGPSGWGSYQTCISHHETHYHNLNNGNKISADVEPLKAVMFFYDKQHELGQQMDDLDFFLQYSADKTIWYTADSDVSIDEKSEVYKSDLFSGYYWRLKIYGYRVTSDDTGCGVNKIRAYYSWLYEDSDRDDSDGPGTEIDTE